MKILRLAFKSLLHRRFATGMTMLSIALSIALLLGVERVRQSGRDAFGGAISKTDLIVGPRTGNLALLLYSVFRIGSPAQNVSMKSVSAFAKHPAVEWVVPFSLGDGYRGFPVVATNADFYDRFKYGNGQSLTFASGNKGSGYFDVVLGATAARTLQHKLGDKIVVSHGHSEDGDGFVKHEEYPFTVSGILAFTGTPVDKTVWITLHAMAAIHEEPDNDHEGHDDHEKEDHHTGDSHDHEDHDDDDHEKEEHQHPHSDQVSGFYLGAKDRTATLGLMREINEFKNEPLLAIMPAVVINDLWRSLAVGETALALVSAMVAVVGICGMWVSLHLLVHGRRREMSILP